MRTFLLILVLIGCSTSPKNVKGPDGTNHKLITCHMIDKCYEEASKVCGKYQIVNTSTEIINNTVGSGSTTKLLVKCEG